MTMSHVAFTFYVTAAMVGMPSIIVLMMYVMHRVRRAMAQPASTSITGGIANPDAILLVLDGMARTIGGLARVAGKVGSVVLNLLAALAVAGLLLACVLFCTARGLGDRETWARLVGGFFAIDVLFLVVVSLLSKTGRRPLRMLIAISIAVFSGYALRALWLGN